MLLPLSIQSCSSDHGIHIHIHIPIDIVVSLIVPCDILSVTSTSPVALQIKSGLNNNKCESTISLSATSSSLGEITLLVQRSKKYESTLWIGDESLPFPSHIIEKASPSGSNTPGSTMTMLALYPDIDISAAFHRDQLFEIVFVVDRSGSMRGEFIRAASDTLVACIASLPEGSRLQIIGFGSRFDTVFKSSDFVEFNDESKSLAMDYASRLAADMGGTEILAPLISVSQYPYSENSLPRSIILITDGEVSNTEEVVNFMRNENVRSGCRCFTFGIGDGASRALMEGCAREGQGACEMIQECGKVEEKVLRQLEKVMTPALSNVKLQWNLSDHAGVMSAGAIGQQSPSAIPSILMNSRLLVFTELNNISSSLIDVNLHAPSLLAYTGITPDGPLTEDVKHVQFINGRILRLFAAKSRLRELEGLCALNAQLNSALSDDYRRRAIAISLELGVLCKWTSFIGIEKRRGSVMESGEEPKRKEFSVVSSRSAKPPVYRCLMMKQKSNRSSGLTSSGFAGVETKEKKTMAVAPPQLTHHLGLAEELGQQEGTLPTRSSDHLTAKCSPPSDELPATSPRDLGSHLPLPGMGVFGSASNPPILPPSANGSAIINMGVPMSGANGLSFPPPPPSAPTTISARAMVLDLLKLQTVTGYWERSKALDDIFRITLGSDPFAEDLPCDAKVWTTLLVLRYLHVKVMSEKTLWTLSAKKAVKYIIRTTSWKELHVHVSNGQTNEYGCEVPVGVINMFPALS